MAERKNPLSPGRRRTIGQLLGGWLFLVFGSLGYAIVRFLVPPSVAVEETAFDAGPIRSIPSLNDGVKLLKINKKGVFVYRTESGEVKALSGMCTHLGCLVEYHGDARQFKCNCHGSVFDISGRNLSGPAPAPLPAFRTEVKGDEVTIFQTKTL